MSDKLENPEVGIEELLKQMRGAIFSGANFKKKIMPLHGTKVEIKQPDLETALDLGTRGDMKEILPKMMIKFVFVPGTAVNVFSEADLEGLKKLPWSKELIDLQNGLLDLIGISEEAVEEQAKNLNVAQLGTT